MQDSCCPFPLVQNGGVDRPSILCVGAATGAQPERSPPEPGRPRQPAAAAAQRVPLHAALVGRGRGQRRGGHAAAGLLHVRRAAQRRLHRAGRAHGAAPGAELPAGHARQPGQLHDPRGEQRHPHRRVRRGGACASDWACRGETPLPQTHAALTLSFVFRRPTWST